VAIKVAVVFFTITILCIWNPLRSIDSRDLSTYPSPIQTARQHAVVDAYQHAWDGYTKHCFGHDTLHPVTNTCEDDFGGYGATAIDSLPTAIIFGNEGSTIQILELIATLNFKVVKGGTRIQVFEITIRHFAAMISAWDLLHGPFSHMAKSPDLRHALYS
jgi:mannosyl-oligosaccharide alpha-1,2-mannosidase